MDAFCEQLVKIKNKGVAAVLPIAVILAAAALSAVLFYYSLRYSILVIFIVAVIYGAAKLFGLCFKEYEYIITNGTVDIDKITAKSNRSRVVSFECADIIKTESSSNEGIAKTVDKVFYCANKSEKAYFIVAKKGEAKIAVLIEPNEKLKKAILDAAPRIIQRDLF